MASSQTTSFTEKKKKSIIDGRLFVQSIVMERIKNVNDDIATMEHVVSRIEQSGLFNLGRQHSKLYDESLVDKFYQEASVRVRSAKKGGDVAEISATICGVEIHINRHLLEDIFSLPSSGLKMEELESFGSEDLLSSFWCVFIGDMADKKVHPSCHKGRFTLPFVYLHDFCCRVVENRTGAFEMCTNLRFRMMVAIVFGKPVNWCQIILKRLQEEVSKPLSQKKSFGLLLTNIFSCLDVHFAMNLKKIGPGKFIGGSKPTAFNKDILPADRPSLFEFPSLKDVTKKSKAVSSKKRKHSLSDKVSQPAAPEKKKKNLRKAHKPKPTEVTATHVEAPIEENAEVVQPTALNLQGATPAEEVVTAISADPEPLAAMPDNQLLSNVEGTGESPAFPESCVTAPVRVSTPVQDPSPHREPSPVRDPYPLREPTPVWIPSSKQAPIPVTNSKPTEIPIPVRSPSLTQLINANLLSVQIEQAFECFIQWKSCRVAVYSVLYHWEDWEEEEKFILEITDTTNISLLIRWENSFCHERIQLSLLLKPRQDSKQRPSPLIMFQVARLTTQTPMMPPFKKGTSKDHSSPQMQEEATEEKIQEESVLPDQPEENQQAEIITPDESRAIPQEDSVPMPDQVDAERQPEDSVPPVPSSTETQVPEVTAPQDEAIQQPVAEPSIDGPASTSSQHMVEIIPEDHLIYPTPHDAL
ncbi:hypothetical protein OROMI_006458 [Orobanche minor]